MASTRTQATPTPKRSIKSAAAKPRGLTVNEVEAEAAVLRDLFILLQPLGHGQRRRVLDWASTWASHESCRLEGPSDL